MHFLCSVKVLFLHQHFKTPQGGGAIRSYYLAKALVDRGIAVSVITAHDKKYKKEIVDGIDVHFLPVPYNNSFGFWRRAISFLKFNRLAVRKAKDHLDANLCYAISVPLTIGLAAQKIKKKYNIPYVFEVGDLWPDAPVQMGFVKNGLFKRFLYAMERKIYEEAVRIVALSPSIKAAIEGKVINKKVDLIPNMADTEFYDKTGKEVEGTKKYDVQGKFVISYIGAIGAANGLDYIIECANASRKAGLSIQFMLCGEGALKKQLQRTVSRLELENVSVTEFVNRDGVKELMKISDAAFICYKPVSILETGSPNKFFDALAAGKLVVINFGGWIRNEIEENNCGFFVDPHRPSDFVKKIKPFLEDRLLLENFQYNSRSLAEKKFSRTELSESFSNLIKESIKG